MIADVSTKPFITALTHKVISSYPKSLFKFVGTLKKLTPKLEKSQEKRRMKNRKFDSAIKDKCNVAASTKSKSGRSLASLSFQIQCGLVYLRELGQFCNYFLF